MPGFPLRWGLSLPTVSLNKQGQSHTLFHMMLRLMDDMVMWLSEVPRGLVGSRQWHITLPEPHTAQLLVPAGTLLVSPCFAGSS